MRLLPGRILARVTALPAIALSSWLLVAFPLLVIGHLNPLTGFVLGLPAVVAACALVPRILPDPPGWEEAPWWPVVAVLAVTVAFAAVQVAFHAEALVIRRDPASYAMYTAWIAENGYLPIPQERELIAGDDPALSYQSLAYYQRGDVIWPQFMAGAPLVLTVGYWLGGRLADRRPEPELLGRLVVGASIFVAAIPFVTEPILDVAAEGLDELSAGAVIGSFFATLFLFAPPVLLLGMVSPFAIRLAVTAVESAGAVAGRLYALSTAGSLLGTFLPALVTIPAFGTQRTLLLSAAVLAVSGSFGGLIMSFARGIGTASTITPLTLVSRVTGYLRDKVIAAWTAIHPGVDTFEDRNLEITGYLPISVEDAVSEARALATIHGRAHHETN